MDKILHPISGEKGFFISELEKKMIDVAINEMASKCDTPLLDKGVNNG